MINVRDELEAAIKGGSRASYLMDLVVRIAAERTLIYEILEAEVGHDKAAKLVNAKLVYLK